MIQIHSLLQLWRVGSSGSSQTNGHVSQLEDGTLLNVTEQPRLLAELKPKLKSHIACAAISRYIGMPDAVLNMLNQASVALARNAVRTSRASFARFVDQFGIQNQVSVIRGRFGLEFDQAVPRHCPDPWV
jgi:hypothetical protein